MVQALSGPIRVVLQRTTADWLIVAATWLIILCATTLVAIGVLYGDAVALTGLQQDLADEPVTSTTVSVEVRAGADDRERIDEAVDRQIGRILGWTGGELVTIAHSESYALPDQPDDETTQLAVFGAYEGLERHAALTEGAWPTPGAEPMQVAVSEAVAARLGLSVGSEVRLANQRNDDIDLDVRVVGVWAPGDPTDAYWRGDPLELEGVAEGTTFTTHGPLVVAFDDLETRAATGDLALTYRALPRLDHLAVDDVGWMRSDVANAERRLAEQLGERTFFQVETDLATILERVNRSLLVSRSGVVVLTMQFAVLAAYALLLVAGLLVEQRRVETALLRSRGAGVGHVALMSLVEAIVLVVPAVVAAPWLAVGVLRLLNVAGPLADAGVTISPRVNDAAIITAAGAGAVAVACLVFPALGSGRGLAAVRQSLARPGNRTLAQRLGFDMALVVLAGVGLWQLRQYGAPLTQTVRGTVGLDPLLVAAPAIGLLAGAILALRIIPLAAEIGERALAPRRGLVAPLGARQLSRRPLRYTRSALLLMLAAALGTFAGAYGSTWTRSQADQAAYRAASDVRVRLSGFPDLPAWALGSAYRDVDGVESALPVALDAFDLERSAGGTILAVDAERVGSFISARPDFADAPLDELVGRLVDPDAGAAGVALEGDPARIEVELDVALEPLRVDEDAPGFSPGFRGIVPELVLRDADGLVHHVPVGRMTLGGGVQEGSVDLAETIDGAGTVWPAYPLELLAIEVEVELPEDAQATGTISLVGIGTAAAEGSIAPLDVDAEPFVATADSPINGYGAARATPVDLHIGTALPAAGPMRALASGSYLAQTGSAVGDVVELGTLGERREYEIVGSVNAFPTLDPADPFLVVDLRSFAAKGESAGEAVEADEWWLAAADGSDAAVAEAVRREPYSAEAVIAHDELRRNLTSDPIALGIIGALALGALASVVFAAIGFVVSATVSTRERLGEFALLQAIGLSHRQLSTWLSIENAFLLAIGLVAGTALGLLLAWVVLPFVTLTQEATLAVPPVEVVIPWGSYAVLYLVAAGVLLLTVVIIGDLLGRVRLSGVLRGGD